MTEDPRSTTVAAPLRRSRTTRLVGGVAGGLAAYFDLDVALVRLAFVALALAGGAGVPLYAAAWLLVPEEGAATSTAATLLQRWSA